jgi:hypothetical protein
MGIRDSRFHWERWTWARLTAAVIWILVTSALGLYFGYTAGFAGGGFFGEPSTTDVLRTGARLMITATVLIAAGPLGVWLLRRRRPWLMIGLVILAVGSALSLTYWFESLNAPSQ